MTKYIYSAAGGELRVIYQTAVPNIIVAIGSARELAPSEIQCADSTDYLLGGSLTLRNGRIDKLQFEEGYCQAEKYASDNSKDDFYYYNRDHLGNVRVVFDEDWDTEQVTHYYPFGGIMAESSGQSVQPWKYGGKELDRTHGLDAYDFGARTYFADRMQWGQVDPLCEKYYAISPYGYCSNNPVLFIDPDGKNDYRFDSKTGTFYLMEKTEDSTDNVYGYKYDKKTGQYRKKKGIFSSQMTNIEKGILKDGLNLKDNDLLISIGGEDNPSVQGVKEFAMGLSELVNREIAGLGYSVDGTDNISDIVIGKYKNNTRTKSSCYITAFLKKYNDSFTNTNILLDFHTHPDGDLGATQSAPYLSIDVQRMRKKKESRPKTTYLVLYRPISEMEEYDYTDK